MTDEKPPADDAVRAAVESGSSVAPEQAGSAGSAQPAAPAAPLEPPGSVAPSEPGAAAAAISPDAVASVPSGDAVASVPSGDVGAGSSTEPEPAASVSRDSVTVRRSPRYGRFIVLGVGAGAIVTFVLTNIFEIDPDVGFGPLFGYLLLFGIPIGAALGGLLAVLLDAITSRRARTVDAERTTVDPTPEELEGDLER